MSANTPVTNAPYTVTQDDTHYLVRIERTLVERKELNRLLDDLLVQAIVRRNEANQAEIDALAADVDRSSTC